jgi:hypothetical protein
MELRACLSQLPMSSSPLRAALRELARNTALTLPPDNRFNAPIERLADKFAPLRALAPQTGAAPQLDGWIAVLRAMQTTLDGGAPAGGDKEAEDGLKSRLSDEAYALGRHDLQKTLGEIWSQLKHDDVNPLFDSFPFKHGAGESAATSAQIDSALAAKQHFWSTFETAIAPVLVATRDGWRAREGHGSALLPSDLLPTVSRMNALASLLYDKEGKPKPLVFRVRPLLLAAPRSDANGVLLASYLQAGGTTVYGFNQRADWTTLKIEWWRPESVAVGLNIGGGDTGRSFRAVTIPEVPWSFWRLLQRASTNGARVFTWQVAGPDGRPVPVQFELKEDPWTQFAQR